MLDKPQGNQPAAASVAATDSKETPKGKKKRSYFWGGFAETRKYDDGEITRFATDLVNRMHLTQGSRNDASRRLLQKNRISILSIMVLSTYAMLFAILSTLDKALTDGARDLLAYVSVFMSAFIASFSIYEAGKRYEVRAENFLRSARKISEIRDRLCATYQSGTLDWKTCFSFDQEYAAILDSHTDNHDDLDFEVFRAKTSERTYFKIKTKIKRSIDVHFLLVLSLVSPIIVFGIFYFTEVWAGRLTPSLLTSTNPI